MTFEIEKAQAHSVRAVKKQFRQKRSRVFEDEEDQSEGMTYTSLHII